MVQEELQVLQGAFHMAHCGTKEGSNAGGRCKLQRLEKVGQESPTRTARENYPWISYSTWRLADQRMALRRTHTEEQQEIRTAARRFQAELQEDRIKGLSKAGVEIEVLVEDNQTRKL